MKRLEITEYGLKALAELVRLQDEASEETNRGELAELLLHFSSVVADAAEDVDRRANIEAAKAAMQDGSDADRLARIKAYRAETGASLDEAKAAVDERMQLEATVLDLRHANDLDAVCAALADEPGADVTDAVLERLRTRADKIRDAARKVA